MSENVLSADNQQERLQILHSWYVAGFVDGEGSFHIAFYKDAKMRMGIKVIPEFHITQNHVSVEVLREIQQYFGCGSIRANNSKSSKDKTYVLVVRNRINLVEKIIPFFEKWNLRTTKQYDFATFARIVRMMHYENAHTCYEGIRKIIFLAYTMNNGGANRKVLLSTLLSSVESSETICQTPKIGEDIVRTA